MTESAQYLERYRATMMNTFGTPRLVLSHGEGAHVWDVDGNRYLDLLGGIAVNALGHGHPALVAAVAEQVRELAHVSNFFASPWQIALGERLVHLVRGGADVSARVFFTNSGTEANEAAFKATRRTGRIRIIAMEGSFHGRTMGSLAITAKADYRTPFEPLPGDVTFVPYGDADALAAVLDSTVAAVVLEPIQGENGVVVPPEGYLRQVRELTRQHGAWLWIDEVQTGIGRTGAWFAHHADSVTPDLVTVAKGLGGGIPIGACLALGPAADALQPGSHGTTFGGNPLAARAALTVLDVIEADGLAARAVTVGDRLAEHLAEVPGVSSVRGRGLLRGVVLEDQVAPAIVDGALEQGYILNAPRPDVLRLAPPLIVEESDLQEFVVALPGLIAAAR